MIEMSYPWKTLFMLVLVEEQNKSGEYTGGRILGNLRVLQGFFFIQNIVNDESLYRRKPKSKFTKADRHG